MGVTSPRASAASFALLQTRAPPRFSLSFSSLFRAQSCSQRSSSKTPRNQQRQRSRPNSPLLGINGSKKTSPTSSLTPNAAHFAHSRPMPSGNNSSYSSGSGAILRQALPRTSSKKSTTGASPTLTAVSRITTSPDGRPTAAAFTSPSALRTKSTRTRAQAPTQPRKPGATASSKELATTSSSNSTILPVQANTVWSRTQTAWRLRARPRGNVGDQRSRVIRNDPFDAHSDEPPPRARLIHCPGHYENPGLL